MTAFDLYRRLFEAYGRQGWWPLTTRAGAPGYDAGGYHPGLHGVPDEPGGRFEIAVGAILTQNTAWRNVALAIAALAEAGCLDPRRVADCPTDALAALIRPAGYFNQKAKKLQLIARIGLERGWWELPGTVPERDELLELWGVGPETADSILLYAWQRPTFVIDAYTRRLLSRLSGHERGTEGAAPARGAPRPCAGALADPGFDPRTVGYGQLRNWFMAALADRSADGTDAEWVVYNEFHALVVQHAKEHCRAKPACMGCPFAGGGVGLNGEDGPGR
jgi:endonuclease-3 related protein